MSKSTLGSFYDYFVPGATEATSEWLPDVLWPDADRRHLIDELAGITRRIATTNERVIETA